MAGMFELGERKVRPGAYFNIQKKGVENTTTTVTGTVAVLFRSDFGPLGEVVKIGSDQELIAVYGSEAQNAGSGITTAMVREALAGGAQTIIACRVGSGGTAATVDLKDNEETPATAVTLTAKYPGAKAFNVTIRTKLSDDTKKECVVYVDSTVFETVEFAAGEGEAAALAAAINRTKTFVAEVATGKDAAVLANVVQKEFTAGTNPTTTVNDYANALGLVEAYDFNVLCCDSNNTAVHYLIQSFVDRVEIAGLFVMAVIAEANSVDLATRMQRAAAYNDEKIVYILNAYVKEAGRDIDAFYTSARIAGMIASASSATSLTHTVVNRAWELYEPLTNTQIIDAETKGCLVLAYNSDNQVWIDSAINTLVTPSDTQDDGWKKIRRTMTRFELMRRMNALADSLIGKIDNDDNGRATVVSQLQTIGDAMIEEDKVISCEVSESTTYAPEGDSAWFNIDVVDKDSMEHIYLIYSFSFSTLAATETEE